MTRLEIAVQIAKATFIGVPFTGDDIETEVERTEARKVCKAIAEISYMMADELLAQDQRK